MVRRFGGPRSTEGAWPILFFCASSSFLGTTRRPWRLPRPDPRIPADVAPADGTALVSAGPPGVGGELDTLIDPRFSVFTASNLSEAFPGPMTPLSLDLAMHAMRASSQSSVQLFGLSEPLATELLRSVAVFGHRVYGGVSVLRELAAVMPGWTPEDIDQQYLGIPIPAERSRKRPSARDIASASRIAAVVGAVTLGFGREVDRTVATARALTVVPGELAACSDAELDARVARLHDETVQAWVVSTFGTVLTGGVLSAVEKAGGRPERSGPDARPLESVGVVEGVAAIADRARSDAPVADVLRGRPPADALLVLRESAPWFATMVDDLVRAHGHRGPGETELANPMFSDAPELLVAAIAKALDAPPRVEVPRTARSRRERVLGRLAHRTMIARERSRDAVVAMTHALRLVVRERGARLAAADVIDDPGDVFFFTFAELAAPPDVAKELVAHRRAERDRLAALRMPALFDGYWEPESATGTAAAVGDVLTGIAASPGVVRAPVRILTHDTMHDLEPGEVLVAATTDTGWTPLFAFAGAIVTDIGAQISHAAVVAREFGVPAVVGTRDASSRLRTGQVVEVDGRVGTVTVVD
jgi:phosphohistidine swiveling domain-containing protein